MWGREWMGKILGSEAGSEAVEGLRATVRWYLEVGALAAKARSIARPSSPAPRMRMDTGVDMIPVEDIGPDVALCDYYSSRRRLSNRAAS